MGATIMETFGKRLKELREAAGMTQEGLARAAELSTSAVARIEQRGKDPAWSTVRRLARRWECPCRHSRRKRKRGRAVRGGRRSQPSGRARAGSEERSKKGRWTVASISKGTGGYRTIQFVGGDGKRRSIRLGKVSQRQAEAVKLRVESLNAALISKCPLDGDTAAWVADVGDDLAAKLAAVGLIPERASAVLGDFLDAYVERRTDIKPRTRINLEACQTRLVEFFGKNRSLKSITPGDADAWLLWLRERYANGTAGRTVKRAKQFFRSATRSRLIPSNPFEDVKPPSQVNESRKHFISKETTQKVLDACPDVEWRLIVALCRYGGIRCPSELLPLCWSEVNWEQGRFLIRSPKTEHHEGGADRWVPIFPELRPYLEDAFERRAGDGLPHQPLPRHERQPAHAATANHPAGWRGGMAEAFSQPAGKPGNGTGRDVSAARRMRVDRK